MRTDLIRQYHALKERLRPGMERYRSGITLHRASGCRYFSLHPEGTLIQNHDGNYRTVPATPENVHEMLDQCTGREHTLEEALEEVNDTLHRVLLLYDRWASLKER